MKNWNGTKGEWRKRQLPSGNIIISTDDWKDFIDVSFTHQYRNTKENREACLANAELISDAGNTIQKCSEFPSTLLEQRDELLSILKGLVSDVGNLLSEYDIEWQQAGYLNEANELINKITNNG